MEPSEKPNQIRKYDFLEVPNLSDSLSEDEDVKTAFKPGFSPQPSRRGSDSSEDMYLDTPSSGMRRVSFADTFGFNLVSVKEFDCWELPTSSPDFDLRKNVFHTEEYVLCPLFDLPSSKEDLMQQLQEQKAILETTEYLPRSTSMIGIIRVLNVSFEKLVYVRMSLDDWQTHYDILAEYVPNSCDGETDQFSFKISLVPPYQKDGSRVEFCIRYETSIGTFWSNNNGVNYTLVCRKKEQEPEPAKPLEEVPSRQIKGCLKVKPSKEESSSVIPKGINFESSKDTDTYVPRIVCSPEDKEDLETSHQNIKYVKREHDEHDEKELQLMTNEHLIGARSTSSRDEEHTFSTDPVNLPKKAEGLEKKIHGEICTDLFKRPLSPSPSTGCSFKGDLYRHEKFSTGHEYSCEPSEEVTSGVEEIKSSLEDANSNALKQSCTGLKEELDDNANPSQERSRGKASCPSSEPGTAGSLKNNLKGRAMKTETKDGGSFRRDLYFDQSAYQEESIVQESSQKDGGGEGEEEEGTHLNLHERGSSTFQSISHDRERKAGCSDANMEVMGAGGRDPTILWSGETAIPRQHGDSFNVPRAHLSWGKVSPAPGHSLTTSVGAALGEMPKEVTASRNGSSLRKNYPPQVEEEKLDWINPEDQNKSIQYKHSWNVLESQGNARGSKTNKIKQTKEQAPCEDMWGKRGNRGSLKDAPTEELFTCQETVSCELSSVADHGITEKAGTAYIIKTTSESIPESMSAREKAIIAKLPQETARSDRPTEEKETAFDPHGGRNDASHYTLCQRDTVGVIYDNDFEKESHLGICNVHVDEMEKEETMSKYNPGKTHDRDKSDIGNITSVEEFSQVITGNRKTVARLDLHLETLPADENIFSENRDHGHAQELSMKTDFDALAPSAFNSGTNRISQIGSHISDHHVASAVPSYEQTTAVVNPIPTMITQSISTKPEANCEPASEIRDREKYPQPEGIPKLLGTVSSSSMKGRCADRISQQRECSIEKSLGPVILISESLENQEEARYGNEGRRNSGQSLHASSDEGCDNAASASLPSQESQTQSNESLLSKYTNSKIPHILLFLVFLVTIYHFDLMIGLAFYLLSLYWLSWKGERQKESVKKE